MREEPVLIEPVHLDTYLHHLVQQEKQAPCTNSFLLGSRDPKAGIFADFLRTGGSITIYSRALEYILATSGKLDVGDFVRRLAGKTYQEITYFYLSRQQIPSRTLISPKRTLFLYGRLYPNRVIKENPLGLDSINGISVPDGLIINVHNGTGRIEAVCEYTSHGDYEYFRNKVDGYEIHKEHFPVLFENSHLLFFIPDGSSLFDYTNFGKNVKHKKLPFSGDEFHDFIDVMFYIHTPNPLLPPLSEIVKTVKSSGAHRFA